jgi:hypothetical protein
MPPLPPVVTSSKPKHSQTKTKTGEVELSTFMEPWRLIRVTRLGKLSSFGWLWGNGLAPISGLFLVPIKSLIKDWKYGLGLLYGLFFENLSDHIFGQVFFTRRIVYYLILTKTCLGYIMGVFFTNRLVTLFPIHMCIHAYLDGAQHRWRSTLTITL